MGHEDRRTGITDHISHDTSEQIVGELRRLESAHDDQFRAVSVRLGEKHFDDRAPYIDLAYINLNVMVFEGG